MRTYVQIKDKIVFQYVRTKLMGHYKKTIGAYSICECTYVHLYAGTAPGYDQKENYLLVCKCYCRTFFIRTYLLPTRMYVLGTNRNRYEWSVRVAVTNIWSQKADLCPSSSFYLMDHLGQRSIYLTLNLREIGKQNFCSVEIVLLTHFFTVESKKRCIQTSHKFSQIIHFCGGGSSPESC